jgi:glucose-6-phosphate isomerase
MKLLIDTSDHVDQVQVLAEAVTLTPYIEHLRGVVEQGTYNDPEASINLSSDMVLLGQVQVLVKEKCTPHLKYIFVVGIGGSNLGTKAIYDALYGMHDMVPTRRPKMIFVDTVNAMMLESYVHDIIATLASKDEYLLVTISKSGGTTETLANTEILIDALHAQLGHSLDRTVVITDEGSAYWQAAQEKELAHLAIPAQVGGRYSVFSAVGLFPLALLGLDTSALRQGACDMRSACLAIDTTQNPAALSAAVLAGAYRTGRYINDNFVFNSELESLGKWYRQLMGESIGKERTVNDEVVHTGLTPTVSIGSTDLHSVGQLYLGGPKDKITTFIYSADTSNALSIPTMRIFPSIVGMITGKKTSDIMNAILKGVQVAYNKNELPFMEVQLAGITPYELGAFMQFKMIEMMYLGKLFNVNPFDQPNVESYKVETKKLLEG